MMIEVAGKGLEDTADSGQALSAVQNSIFPDDSESGSGSDRAAEPESGLRASLDEQSGLVKFSCHECGSRYALPAERIRGRVLTIRCKSCATLFEVQDTWSISPSSVLARGAKVWFVAIDKQHFGPMTAQEVRERWERGELTGRTFAWRQGLPSWTRLKEIGELYDESGGESAGDEAATAPPADECYPGPLAASEAAPAGSSAMGEAPSETPTQADLDARFDALGQHALDSEITAVAETPPDVWAAALGEVLPVSVDSEHPTLVTEQADAPAGSEDSPDLGSAVAAEPLVGPPAPGLFPESTIEYPPGFAESTIGLDGAGQVDFSPIAAAPGREGSAPRDIFDEVTADGGVDYPHLSDVEEPRAELVVRQDLLPAAGDDLIGERNEDSVLFSLDHLLADAPTSDWASWQGRRLPEDSLVLDPRARALIVPPPSVMVQTAQEIQGRGGFGRLLLAAVMGAFLGAGTLLAAVYWISSESDEDLFAMLPSDGRSAATVRSSTAPVVVPPSLGQPGMRRADEASPAETAPRLMAPSGSEAPERAAEAQLVAPSPEDFDVADAAPQRGRAVRRLSPQRAVARRPARQPAARRPAARRPTVRRRARARRAAAAAPAVAVQTQPAASRSQSARLAAIPDVDDEPAGPQLTAGQVGAGLAGARPGLTACRQAYGQPIALTLSLVIDGVSGRVKRGRVMPAFLDSQLRSCVLAAVSTGAKFPSFDGAPLRVTRPVFLR